MSLLLTESTTPSLSVEWLNENLIRTYPLQESGVLPTRAIVDFIAVVQSDKINAIGITKIINTATGWALSLCGTHLDTNGNIIKVCDFETDIFIPYYPEAEIKSENKYTIIPFELLCVQDGESHIVEGKLTVGDPGALEHEPPVTVFDTPKLFLDRCVIVLNNFARSIVINGTAFVGDVTLVAGEGVDIIGAGGEEKATGVFSGGTISFTNTKYTSPENSDIIDDAALTAMAIERLGRPIASICGCTVSADSENKNVDIALPVATDNDSLYIVGRPHGDGVVQLDISQNPALSIDAVKTLTDNIRQLDIRCERIDATITVLDSAINSIASQLTTIV